MYHDAQYDFISLKAVVCQVAAHIALGLRAIHSVFIYFHCLRLSPAYRRFCQLQQWMVAVGAALGIAGDIILTSILVMVLRHSRTGAKKSVDICQVCCCGYDVPLRY